MYTSAALTCRFSSSKSSYSASTFRSGTLHPDATM
jgi:hypothetical protein